MQLKREIKFETLRKSHKKQIIIGSVLVCVIGSILTFNLTRAKYRLTQSMKLVTGTINYKVPDMRIVAVNISEDGTNYEIVDDIPESGYQLNEEKSICKVATETSGIENAPKDNNITVKYENNKISFYGIAKRNTRCYLYFDKYTPSITISDIIASFGSNLKSGKPDFTKIAKGAETVADNGIYKVSDPMYEGTSYYWRGAATTNHVIFANKCWRIVRINGDGSIRLIYNGAVQSGNTCLGNGANTSTTAVTSQTYSKGGVYNNSAYVGYTYTVSKQRPEGTPEESNLKTQTDTWYNSNIGNNEAYASHVADGKFCNDRNTKNNETWSATGSTFYYGAYTRLSTNKTPTLSCDAQDVYTLKAGAITADEVAFAGVVVGTSNSSYYLYNNIYYWTMSPSHWNGSNAFVFRVNTDGNLSVTTVSFTSLGVRPVINLRSDATFSSGSDGTQNKPYIVAS